MPDEPYRLPDRPTNMNRPDIDQLRKRYAKLKTRQARLQAGKDGKN